MKIPIETTGRILSGHEPASFVKVLRDEDDAGGFYVLTSATERFEPCFDNWVEDEADLVAYFQDWQVEWLAADR